MYHFSSYLTTNKHGTLYKHQVDGTENTKEEQIPNENGFLVSSSIKNLLNSHTL